MIGKFFEIIIGGALGGHLAVVANMGTILFMGFTILTVMMLLTAWFPKWASVLV